MGALITGYVAFSVLAMMNVITGIFVENAATFSKEDKDHYVVSHVLNLFKKSNLNENAELSLVEFQRMLETKELRELFQAVDVDVNDAESLFRLLDIDETGTLSPQELVDGWIRLRGPAKALDLAVLMSDNNRMDAKIDWMCDMVSDIGTCGVIDRGSVGAQPSYWDDIKLLYEASASLELPVGHSGAFHVALDGRANWHEGRWLLSGVLLSGWFSDQVTGPSEPMSSTVVAMTEAVYQAIARHSKVLRILQAKVSQVGGSPVIDTCQGTAVVAGTCMATPSDTVEVVEVFCGSFNGWSQGVRVLNSFGLKGRLKWLLDVAEDCYQGCRHANPGATCIFEQTDLLETWQSEEPSFVCASLEHVWWLQGPALTNPRVLCASAPCQPWSTGGTGSGLDDQDGLLMLHLFGQLAFLKTPIVLLEQVAGFRNHHHYDIVEQAWKDSGYREVWSGVSDLIEFSPVTRKRFLIVLVHQSMPAHQLMEDKPVLPPRPTLGSFDCILELPWEVEQACTPSQEALSMYLDPWY
ncbi:mspIM, partial [Symbiodinium sp. KB8]